MGDGHRKIRYTYDFDDNWNHDVVLEKTLPSDSNNPSAANHSLVSTS